MPELLLRHFFCPFYIWFGAFKKLINLFQVIHAILAFFDYIFEYWQGVFLPYICGFRRAHMKNLMKRFNKNEAGATAIEYGLIAALIAVVLITALTSLGNNMSTKFNAVSTAVAAR